jgi:hypothetical protein
MASRLESSRTPFIRQVVVDAPVICWMVMGTMCTPTLEPSCIMWLSALETVGPTNPPKQQTDSKRRLWMKSIDFDSREV